MASDYQNIKNLPLSFVNKMIMYKLEKENETKAWNIWLAIYNNMTEDTFKPFHVFYDDLKPKQVSQISKDELLDKAASIRKKISRQKG